MQISLLEPNFVGLVTENGTTVDFLGIPTVLMTYSGTVIPAIVAIYVYSHLEKILKRFIPKSIQIFALSMVALLIMVPRFIRYAAIQERLIGPDGTYPVIGRSSTYRFGAFQALAQAALQDSLPTNVTPAQVRCGLTAVVEKGIRAAGTFDEKGWLLPGVCGHQPALAESYIGIGSLYLCLAVFLPLGISENAAFWKEKDTDWSSKKIWQGEEIAIDHSI
ncbi:MULTISPECIES: DUF2264 domain-containing protein [Niallia]|uniref:DUF2264 domain-containing protein n=1 Tax=Niallia TaxID=2837506 RepID=UPI00197CADCB|nr:MULTISPECIES: DUF2264 domain-containing protein [Niallia]MBQ6448862.1 DUF2264 domain-containing protein [Bacillus sp. (in: firmicutes)]UTI42738.1 DUF2264 domain-containing protein [Niallia sp. RD1]